MQRGSADLGSLGGRGQGQTAAHGFSQMERHGGRPEARAATLVPGLAARHAFTPHTETAQDGPSTHFEAALIIARMPALIQEISSAP
jgi:hypothetical protein